MVETVKKTRDWIKIRKVIASVYDKEGLMEFLDEMIKTNSELKVFSSGGTYKELMPHIPKHIFEISSYTEFPEMPSGLVKTLHPRIHGGILGDTLNPEHTRYMERNSIEEFDMVIVNLYPFKKIVEKKEPPESARSNIDIGGVALLYAAAKNFLRVCVITDPKDAKDVLKKMSENDGMVDLKFRHKMAIKAMDHVKEYISSITEYLHKTDLDEFLKCYENE